MEFVGLNGIVVTLVLFLLALFSLMVLGARFGKWMARPYGHIVRRLIVHENQMALVATKGRITREVRAGSITLGPNQTAWVVPLQERTVAVSPQELLTEDRFQIKLTATLVGRVTDARTFALAVSPEESSGTRWNADAAIYRDARIALRQIATGRSLEAMLSDRPALDAALLDALADTEPRYGFKIERAVMENVILPAEVRRAYSEAERVRLESLAALERARGEQAAMRSLANTARMLKNNPELMNLRVLQTVDGLDPRKPVTIVLGEGVMTRLSDGPHEKG